MVLANSRQLVPAQLGRQRRSIHVKHCPCHHRAFSSSITSRPCRWIIRNRIRSARCSKPSSKSSRAVGRGFEVGAIGIARDPAALCNAIRERRPDVVFNLFEGLPEWGETEGYCIALLEWLGVPFTGSTLAATCLTRDKGLTKQLLRGAGLPTAAYFVVEALPVPPCPLAWPLIVKPGNQDASVGLDQGSIVSEQSAPGCARRAALDRIRPADPGRRVHRRPGILRWPVREPRTDCAADCRVRVPAVARRADLADHHLRRQVEAGLGRLRNVADAVSGDQCSGRVGRAAHRHF